MNEIGLHFLETKKQDMQRAILLLGFYGALASFVFKSVDFKLLVEILDITEHEALISITALAILVWLYAGAVFFATLSFCLAIAHVKNVNNLLCKKANDSEIEKVAANLSPPLRELTDPEFLSIICFASAVFAVPLGVILIRLSQSNPFDLVIGLVISMAILASFLILTWCFRRLKRLKSSKNKKNE